MLVLGDRPHAGPVADDDRAPLPRSGLEPGGHHRPHSDWAGMLESVERQNDRGVYMSWFDTRAEQASIAADDGATLLTDMTDEDFADQDVSAALVAFRLAKQHLDIARRRHAS